MPLLAVRPEAAPEPTAALGLSWGDHRSRTWAAGALLVVGGALIAPTTAYTVPVGLFGCLLHLLGWAVLPGSPARRAAVALPSMLACWCTMLGPRAMWTLALVLVLWLLVRARPARSYATVVLPLAAGLVAALLYSSPADKAPAFALVAAATIAAAVLARLLALRVVLRPALGTRPSGVLMNRIATVDAEWSDTP